MSNLPLNSSPLSVPAPDFLSRASSLLAAEIARFQPSQLPALTGLGPSPSAGIASSSDPITSALSSGNVDDLRRRGTDFLETLLSSLSQDRNPGRAGSAGPLDVQVPLVRGVASVTPGGRGRATIRVANEEASALEVSLYSSNFVADSGYDLPSLLVSVTPRKASIPPGGQVTFDIEVAVPGQTPRGSYSGLVQASGCKYVKAVVLFEVL